MADDKKAALEAELAKAKAENAELAGAAAELKTVKAELAKQAAQLKTVSDQNKALEAELMKTLEAQPTAKRGSPEALIETLVNGQAKLSEAVALLLEQKQGPKEARKSDGLPELPEQYRGKKYYLRSEDGYSKGKYYEKGTIKILRDAVPAMSDIPCDRHGKPTGEPRRDGRPVAVPRVVEEESELEDGDEVNPAEQRKPRAKRAVDLDV